MSSSYYIETSSAAAVDGGIEAVDTNNGSSQESSDNANSRTDTGTAGAGTEGAMPNDMPRDMGGQNGGPAMTTGDFSLVGFSSDEALVNAPNGSFTMNSGKAFDYDASDGNPVLVSKTLADANNLKVGSTFKLANISDSKKTYTFTVAGIYSNTQESNMPMGGPMASSANDAANAIYMSAATLGKIGLDSTKTLSITDSKGNTRETSAAQLSFTYVFDGKADYDRFTEDVRKAGLSDDYTVSSMDVEQYGQSLVPIDNLSKFARTMLIVVLSVGAVVLVILTIFNISRAQIEIGVLTAIGVKKWKVAAQFAVELLTVVLIGLIVGTGIRGGDLRAGIGCAALLAGGFATITAGIPASTVRTRYARCPRRSTGRQRSVRETEYRQYPGRIRGTERGEAASKRHAARPAARIECD